MGGAYSTVHQWEGSQFSTRGLEAWQEAETRTKEIVPNVYPLDFFTTKIFKIQTKVIHFLFGP